MDAPSSSRKLVIDLDGVLCTLRGPGQSYWDTLPITSNIKRLNDMIDKGWHVTIFTARGMDTYVGDVRRIKQMLGTPTRDWLARHGVRYHVLKFGKPPADHYVDDKGAGFDMTVWSADG